MRGREPSLIIRLKYDLTIGRDTATVARRGSRRQAGGRARDPHAGAHRGVPDDGPASGSAVVGDEPGHLTLQVGDAGPRGLEDDWTQFTTWDRVRVRAQRVIVDGLQPSRRYPLRLVEGNVVRATATTVTLPDALPAIDERPFTCLLGSCFGRLSDGAGAVGAAMAKLPAQYRPDVTFLCGDQVYLDAPFPRFLTSIHSGEGLRLAPREVPRHGPKTVRGRVSHRCCARVRRTSPRTTTSSGTTPPTRHRSCSRPGSAVRGTSTGRWRRPCTTCSRLRRGLLGLTIGRLSFLVVDLRMDRTSGSDAAAARAGWSSWGDWIDDLDGPGVLVLGQPVLSAEPAGGQHRRLGPARLSPVRPAGRRRCSAPATTSSCSPATSTSDASPAPAARRRQPLRGHRLAVRARRARCCRGVGRAARAIPGAACRAPWAAPCGTATTTGRGRTTSRRWLPDVGGRLLMRRDRLAHPAARGGSGRGAPTQWGTYLS